MFHIRSDSEPRGQVLVIVAVAFTAMMALLAVLFDGANGMVTRRDMQDGGDAAALAGANIVQVGTPRGCATVAGGSTPRASIIAAVNASLAINLPWYDVTTASITCPAGYENQAVAVELSAAAPQFLGGFVGGQIQVSTRSAAVNKIINTTQYSIVQLDPGNAGWPNGRKGCPSVLLSGGPTVVLQATMHVNSNCSAGNGGALSTNGNGGSLTMQNGAPINLVGGYAAGSMTISPAPTTGATPILDPLRNLPPVNTASMPVRSNNHLILSNVTQIFEPGIYRGGIELRNSSVALLRPGIFVLEGGGFDIGSQAKVLSISTTVSTPNYSNWAGDCPVDQCGVLIYNTGTANGANAMDSLAVAAGATVKLRAYDPDAMNGTGTADFENILIWQAATPVPTATYEQPMLELKGGGNIDIRGTVYAPSAKVEMGGNSGGAGGDTVNVTLQFISWDLEFRGNSAFTFYFNDAEFVRPIDYGLVE
jgi:hypothetical protein